MEANKLQVLILGGGYAGLMAAARLAHKPGIAVTLVDRKPFFQQRIRWHQVMAGDAIKAGDYRQWLAKADIGFIQSEVVSLDLERRQAELSTVPAGNWRTWKRSRCRTTPKPTVGYNCSWQPASRATLRN